MHIGQRKIWLTRPALSVQQEERVNAAGEETEELTEEGRRYSLTLAKYLQLEQVLECTCVHPRVQYVFVNAGYFEALFAARNQTTAEVRNSGLAWPSIKFQLGMCLFGTILDA